MYRFIEILDFVSSSPITSPKIRDIEKQEELENQAWREVPLGLNGEGHILIPPYFNLRTACSSFDGCVETWEGDLPATTRVDMVLKWDSNPIPSLIKLPVRALKQDGEKRDIQASRASIYRTKTFGVYSVSETIKSYEGLEVEVGNLIDTHWERTIHGITRKFSIRIHLIGITPEKLEHYLHTFGVILNSISIDA